MPAEKPCRHARRLVQLGLVAGLAMLPASAGAGIIIDIAEVGSDVQITGSGSFDTDALDFFMSFSGTANGFVDPALRNIGFGTAATSRDLYDFTTLELTVGPGSFGSGALTVADSSTGDLFSLSSLQRLVVLPAGYVSGSPISGSSVFNNATLASLGIDPGTYVWTIGNRGPVTDTVQVNIVPEPSSIALVALGALTLAWLRQRTLRRSSHATR